jgi:hypothetical protein
LAIAGRLRCDENFSVRRFINLIAAGTGKKKTKVSRLRSCTNPLNSPEFKLRANSSSPLKWNEIPSVEVFSPLERTCAISHGIDSTAGEWAGARSE